MKISLITVLIPIYLVNMGCGMFMGDSMDEFYLLQSQDNSETMQGVIDALTVLSLKQNQIDENLQTVNTGVNRLKLILPNLRAKLNQTLNTTQTLMGMSLTEFKDNSESIQEIIEAMTLLSLRQIRIDDVLSDVDSKVSYHLHNSSFNTNELKTAIDNLTTIIEGVITSISNNSQIHPERYEFEEELKQNISAVLEMSGCQCEECARGVTMEGVKQIMEMTFTSSREECLYGIQNPRRFAGGVDNYLVRNGKTYIYYYNNRQICAYNLRSHLTICNLSRRRQRPQGVFVCATP